MNALTIFLMSLTLNAQTGEELARHVESGPYKSVEECSVVQIKTGITRPTVAPTTGKLVVVRHECVLLSEGDKTT
jgi:hypothetical protein